MFDSGSLDKVKCPSIVITSGPTLTVVVAPDRVLSEGQTPLTILSCEQTSDSSLIELWEIELFHYLTV